jgi:hypothetical protein
MTIFLNLASMKNTPVKTKTAVPALLVRLSVVFALVTSLLSYAVTPASAYMQSDGYYDCNTGVRVALLPQEYEDSPPQLDMSFAEQSSYPSTYIIWDLQLWSGYSCVGDVVVSVEAGNIQAPAFSGNQNITSIFIPANTQIPNEIPEEFASERPFAGTTGLHTFYYCGSQNLANTGLAGKTRITCPSAPTIDQVFSFGDYTYINFTPGDNGGSPIDTYTVRARRSSGVTSSVPFSGPYNGFNGGLQIEIRGLPGETNYTFTIISNNGYFDSNASTSSQAITTSPGSGWYLCATGERTPDQAAHPLSYRINDEADVVENNGCNGHVIIRPGVLGIYSGFRNSLITSVSIPGSVVSLSRAFEGSSALSQVTFLDDSMLSNIGMSSFKGTNLSAITIPSSVEQIGDYAFQDSAQLSQVNFEGDSQLYLIDYQVFKGTNLSTITIPASVTQIEPGAFDGMDSLSSIQVADANTSYRSVAGVLFNLDGNNSLYQLIKYPQAKTGSSYTIPSNVEMISFGAFKSTGLSFVDIPPSVNSIGENAFYDTELIAYNFCTSLDLTGTGLVPQQKVCYKNWRTPLPAITNGGPKIGDRIYASAFERALPRTLLQPEFRANLIEYPTPEEYVYRITTEENVPLRSVDHQPHMAYQSLSAEDQRQWYIDANFGGDDYRFTWKAFMCVNEAGNVQSKPTGITYSYVSREDGLLLDGSFSAAYNLMFEDAAGDYILNQEQGQTTRSIVGGQFGNETYSNSFLGDTVNPNFGRTFGILDIDGSCGEGKSFRSFTILDSEGTPITTKSFVIPQQFDLLYDENLYTSADDKYFYGVDPTGITIGVTGGVLNFNAALWGLTTIEESSSTPLASPTITGVSPTTTTTLTVSFTVSPNATSVNAYIYSAASGGSALQSLTNQSTGFSFTGLNPSTTYYISLAAVGTGNYTNSGESARTSGTTLAAAVAPSVSAASSSASIYVGQSVTFTATASTSDGGTLSYQWSFGGSAISQATSAQYSFTSSSLNQSGSYSVTVTNSRNGTTNTATASVSLAILEAIRIDPMLPVTKPIVTLANGLIMCTIGTYSQIATSAVFSLFVDGKHISTNFSAEGDRLPDWILPWTTPSTITRTATLNSAAWAMSDTYRGKSVNCATLAYSKHATGLINSETLKAP